LLICKYIEPLKVDAPGLLIPAAHAVLPWRLDAAWLLFVFPHFTAHVCHCVVDLGRRRLPSVDNSIQGLHPGAIVSGEGDFRTSYQVLRLLRNERAVHQIQRLLRDAR